MNISKLHCSDCGGQSNLIAFWPGRYGQQATLFRPTRSVPEKCWCATCWQKKFGTLKENSHKVRAGDS